MTTCGTVTGGFTLGLGKPPSDTWKVVADGTSCTFARDWVERITSVFSLKQEHPSTFDHQVVMSKGAANPEHGYKCLSAANGPAHGGGCYTSFHSGHPVKAPDYFTWIPIRSVEQFGECPDATGAKYTIGTAGAGGLDTTKYTVGGYGVTCSFADRWVARLSGDSPQHLGHPPGYECTVGSAYANGPTAANGDCVKPGARAAGAFFHWDPDPATYVPSLRRLIRSD